MNGPFKVGEICIGQHLIHWPEYNGAECVILTPERIAGGMDPRSGEAAEVGPTYTVQWDDGRVANIATANLRRKQPPTGLIAVLRMFDVAAPKLREVEAA